MQSVRRLLQSILFGLFFCGLTTSVFAGELEDRRFDKQISELFAHYQIDYEGNFNDALVTLEEGRFQFWYLMGHGIQTSPLNFPISKVNTKWTERAYSSKGQTEVEHDVYFDGRTFVYVRTETAHKWKTVEERVLRPHPEGLSYEHREKYFRWRFPFAGPLIEDSTSREGLAHSRNQKFILRPIKKGLMKIGDFYASALASPNFGANRAQIFKGVEKTQESMGAVIDFDSARMRRQVCENGLKHSDPKENP